MRRIASLATDTTIQYLYNSLTTRTSVATVRTMNNSYTSRLGALLAVCGVAMAIAAPVAAAHPERNIVRTAVAAGQFKTLTALLKQAGLAKTLAGKGRFTV